MRFFCKPAALCVGPNSSTSASTRAISLSSGTKASPKTNSCEGVFPDYQNRELQKNFVAYSIFAAVDESSEYTFGLGANSMTNLFSKKCSKQGILRKTRLGTIHACNHCHDDFYVGYFVLVCFNVLLFTLTINVYSVSIERQRL